MAFTYKECLEFAQSAIGCRVIKAPSSYIQLSDKLYSGILRKLDSSHKATILWDNGVEETFLLSEQDVLIYDNSASGEHHYSITCDSCMKSNIYGPRYKCCVCYDFDLCFKCYHEGKHDKSHRLSRIMYGMKWVDAPERRQSGTTTVHAMSVGSEVRKGLDWPSDDTSVKDNDIGKISVFMNWKEGHFNSGVNVEWGNLTKNCRLGYNGKSDIQLAGDGTLISLYHDHLLSLSDWVKHCFIPTVDGPLLGDKVMISVSASDLEILQNEHGGYNNKMEEQRGKVAMVMSIQTGGDIVVKFPDKEKFRLNPKVLKVVQRFDEVVQGGQTMSNGLKIGEKVCITTDEANCMRLQRFHGEWNSSMSKYIGKIGILIRFDEDGDAVVGFNKRSCSFIYNPTLLEKYVIVENESEDNDFTQEMNQRNVKNSTSEPQTFLPMVGCCVVSSSKFTSQDNAKVLGTVSEVCTDRIVVSWSNDTKETIDSDQCNNIRLYDSAPSGIVHENTKCKTCTTSPISGTLWQCYDCSDFYLCSDCYHRNEHNLQHKFWRINKPQEEKFLVECRNQTSEVMVSGVLPGATIGRCSDWVWGDEDGGSGSTGKVTALKDWDEEKPRSAARVKWDNGVQKTYRAGYKGDLDLVVIKPNPVQCYVDHLAVLDIQGFVENSEHTFSSSKEFEPSEQTGKVESVDERSTQSKPLSTHTSKKHKVTYDILDVRIGTRIVKGETWEFDEQRVIRESPSDIGNLGDNVKMLGTVVEISDDINVTWDDGQVDMYDAVEFRDLLVVELSPSGIKHSGISCHFCLASTIFGVRWSCRECRNVDLCSTCYFTDKHDTEHTFYRIPDPNSARFLVGPRSEAKKWYVTGLLPGSTVQTSLQYETEYPLEKHFTDGKITSLCNWTPNFPCSAAKVTLDDGSTKTYQIGFEGKVNLFVVHLASTHLSCYFEHLHAIGSTIEIVESQTSANSQTADEFKTFEEKPVVQEESPESQSSVTENSLGGFSVNQSVIIVDTLTKSLADKVEFQRGTVKKFDEAGIHVFVPGINETVICDAGMLMVDEDIPTEKQSSGDAKTPVLEEPKMSSKSIAEEKLSREARNLISQEVEKEKSTESLKTSAKSEESVESIELNERRKGRLEVGDQVKVVKDPDCLRILQQGHGGWNDDMTQYIGEVGTVTEIDDDDDVKVHYSSKKRFYYNPSALEVHRSFYDLKPTDGQQIQVGDKVIIHLDEEVVKEMQEGHGGWNNGMKCLLNKVGTVIMCTDGNVVAVRFECDMCKFFNPFVFRKLDPGEAKRQRLIEKRNEPKSLFKVGEKVRITTNIREAIRIQKAESSWDYKMTEVIGKIGIIRKIVGGKLLRILFASGKTFEMHQEAVMKYKEGNEDYDVLSEVPFQVGDFIKCTQPGNSVGSLLSLIPGLNDKEEEVGCLGGYDVDMDLVVIFADKTKMVWKPNTVRLATAEEIKTYGANANNKQLKVGDKVTVNLGGGLLAGLIGRSAGIDPTELSNIQKPSTIVGFDNDGDPILQPAGGGKRFAIPKLVVQKLEEIPPLFTNIKVGDTVEIDWDGLDDITGAFGSRSVFRAPGRTGTVVGFDGVKDPEVLFQGGVKKIIPIKLVKKVELGREFSEFREAKPSSKTTKSFQPSNKETAPKMVHKFKVGSQVCVRKKFSEFLKEQEEHGGWNNEMMTVLYAVGDVDGYDEDGDIQVMYEDGRKWTMNPESLEEATLTEIKAGVLEPVTATKVKYKIGDEVSVTLPVDVVKTLQDTHGGWMDTMDEILTNPGEVVGLDQDEDLVVKYESGKKYFVNPAIFKSNVSSTTSSVQTECEHKVSDWVRVSNDKVHVTKIQEDTGLKTNVENLYGKTVRVSDVISDRVIQVQFRGDNYSLDVRVVTKAS